MGDRKHIFSRHSDLFKTSGIFVQTVRIGIPLGEQKAQQMNGDTLHSYTPEKAVCFWDTKSL